MHDGWRDALVSHFITTLELTAVQFMCRGDPEAPEAWEARGGVTGTILTFWVLDRNRQAQLMSAIGSIADTEKVRFDPVGSHFDAPSAEASKAVLAAAKAASIVVCLTTDQLLQGVAGSVDGIIRNFEELRQSGALKPAKRQWREDERIRRERGEPSIPYGRVLQHKRVAIVGSVALKYRQHLEKITFAEGLARLGKIPVS